MPLLHVPDNRPLRPKAKTTGKRLRAKCLSHRPHHHWICFEHREWLNGVEVVIHQRVWARMTCRLKLVSPVAIPCRAVQQCAPLACLGRSQSP